LATESLIGEVGRSIIGRMALAGQETELTTLEAIQDRVLWLATSIVHHANKVRRTSSGVKVGGHQASSASMVSIMTALWFHHLRGQDRVSVKPHASPVLHAIEYLLGRLDRSYLKRLRDFGGLQSYPSRTKDPFRVDFSTGSVGLGSAAPLFAALGAWVRNRNWCDPGQAIGGHGGERAPEARREGVHDCRERRERAAFPC
jgi:pyruvate dehydrogenase E1 component